MALGTKSRWALAILALGVLVGALGWLLIERPEPVYQGRAEHVWIMSLTNVQSAADVEHWKSLGPDAVPLLVKALGMGDTWRDAALRKLQSVLPGRFQSRVPAPANMYFVRSSAALLIRALGTNAVAAAPALARAVDDENANVGLNAMVSLQGLWPVLGKEKDAMLPEFLSAMNSTNAMVRERAIGFLALYPEQFPQVLPPIVGALKDTNVYVRNKAIMALSSLEFANGGAGVVTALTQSLTNDDARVRAFAASKLGASKQQAGVVVPALLVAMNDGEPQVRHAAIVALGKYGGDAKPAVPGLVRALDAGEVPIRNSAAESLKQIDPETAAKVLAERAAAGK